TTVAKILAHRENHLPSIVGARPDIPAALGGVMAKLLTKNPADRYQTPAEVAAALVPFIDSGNQTATPKINRGWLIAAAAWFFGLFVTAGIVIYRIQIDRGELVITTDRDDVKVVVMQGGRLIAIIDTKTKKKLTLRSGVYELELKGAQPGLKLDI